MSSESHVKEAALDWFKGWRTNAGEGIFATPERRGQFTESAQLDKSFIVNLRGVGYGG